MMEELLVLASRRIAVSSIAALALATLPIRSIAKDHRPEPFVTTFTVHFYVTSEKKMEDAVSLTALDKNGTIVAGKVVQPAQSDWAAQQDRPNSGQPECCRTDFAPERRQVSH